MVLEECVSIPLGDASAYQCAGDDCDPDRAEETISGQRPIQKEVHQCHWQHGVLLCYEQRTLRIDTSKQSATSNHVGRDRHVSSTPDGVDPFEMELLRWGLQKVWGQDTAVMPPKLHLRFKGITPKTVALYRREVQRFLDYATAELGRLPINVVELDECMGEFINELYQEGEAVSHAGWLLSGFKRFLPSLRRDLVTAQQYYNNWVRDHVPFRAVPMPWGVAKTLAAAAYEGAHHDLSLLLLLGYAFYLRTMELVTLKTTDVHVDRRSDTIILTLAKTKTARNHQQTVALQHSGLAKIVVHLLAHLAPGPLWHFSPRGFRLCFNAIIGHCHANSCGFTVYSLRRGGATHAYVCSRSLDLVIIQGRWRDQRTARIYCRASHTGDACRGRGRERERGISSELADMTCCELHLRCRHRHCRRCRCCRRCCCCFWSSFSFLFLFVLSLSLSLLSSLSSLSSLSWLSLLSSSSSSSASSSSLLLL